MNQTNQENDLDAAPPSIPVKRKRGRPRKDWNLNFVESVHVPPGFKGANGNHPRQVDPIDDPKDDMVGQAVTGVVEVAFDAGYLLRVRIGNSNSYLRGVVFKPGHYVPISAQNDIAPHVEMIRRNDTHRSAENQTRVRGRNRRTRERNENSLILNGSPPANQALRLAPRTANLVASKGKHVYSVAAPSVPLVGSRGTVVPVILQPVSLSNGLPFSVQVPAVASQANHEPLKGKQVQTQDEIERVQLSSRSSEAHIEKIRAASKYSAAEDSDHKVERVHADVNEPLLIEPLQAIRSDGRSAPKVLENNRAGRMSELLQVVQENMAENQEIQVENLSTDTGFESHELKSPETDCRGEETVLSKKRFRASSD